MENNKKKIIFMGTPDFAVPYLEVLHENYDVVLVVSQPDRMSGRGKKINPPPVKEKAIELGLDVAQFEKINSDEAREFLSKYDIDFIVAVAYGQILKKWLIDLPKYCCLNVHASLLPKLRGAAPIQWSILNGFDKTGITIMEIDEGLDTGDMLAKVEIKINGMNGGELHDTLKLLGRDALIQSIEEIVADVAIPIRQNPNLASYAPLIQKSDMQINWCDSSIDILNKIRAFSPNPCAYAFIKEIRLKIISAVNAEIDGLENYNAGDVVLFNNSHFIIRTSDGAIDISSLQPENSKPMSISEFYRGYYNKLMG